jgi:predicted nucleotidyltransferase
VTGSISLEEIQRIRSIVGPIASRRGGFSRIYLFGSRARGGEADDCDYDFCVYPDDDVSFLKLAGLLDDLTKGLSGNVDIVDATALDPDSFFFSEIERDGVLIYER